MLNAWSCPSATRVMAEKQRLRDLARRLVRNEADAELLVRAALSQARRHRVHCTTEDVGAWTRAILCRCLFAAWCRQAVPGAAKILDSDAPAPLPAPARPAGRLLRLDRCARRPGRHSSAAPQRTDGLRRLLLDTPA